MAWQDQGRQEHGWFGHGMAADGGGLFGPSPDALARRTEAVAYGAVAALPRALRARAEENNDAATRARLAELVAAWGRGGRLADGAFAGHFFGRGAGDPVVAALREAALRAGMAVDHAELARAAEKLGEAMQAVGLERWPRFLADAQARAREPATVAAVAESLRCFNPMKDAIRPVYPVEALVGIGGAAIGRGTIGAARALGRAIVRQALPKADSRIGDSIGRSAHAEEMPSAPNVKTPSRELSESDASATVVRPRISRQKQDSHVHGTPQSRNRLKHTKPTSMFDGSAAEADMLTQEAWEKRTPLKRETKVRDYNFKRRVGTGPHGGGQSLVRVHQDESGRIHGHPVGPETP